MPGPDRRRIVAVALVVLALIALLVWLLSRPAEPEFVLPPDAAPAAAAPQIDPANARAPRRRDEAPTPETPPEATTSDVPADVPMGHGSDLVPAKPKPTFPFRVTVLRGDGAPARGATVLLVDPEPDDGDDPVLRRATAGDDGAAAFDAPDFVFRVAAWLGAEATATGEVIHPKERSAVTVRLTTAMTVRGRVLRGETPEPGAKVELTMCPWFGSEFAYELRAKSGADGRFEFPPIPTAGVDPLNPPYLVAVTDDRARGYAETDMANPGAEVVVRLTPGFALKGRLIDTEGQPIAADIYSVGARTTSFRTDPYGRFDQRQTEGWRQFLAVRLGRGAVISGYTDADPIVTRWKIATPIGRREEGESGDIDLGDVVIRPAKPVTGRVTDAAGKAVPRAKASLFLRDFHVGTVVGNYDGRFEFPEVGDAPHRVEVRGIGDVRGVASIENVRGGDPELRLVLGAVPASCTVQFRFFSETDRSPVKSLEIRVKAWRHGETSRCADAQSMGTTPEDAMDSYAVAIPEAGSFDVEVSVGGYEPQRFESVEVVAGRETVIDLLLRRKAE